VTLDSVAAAHRELNIKPVGDLWPQEGLFFRSTTTTSRRRACPSSSSRPVTSDYHQVSDSPDKIDAEKEARSHDSCSIWGCRREHVPATALEPGQL